MYYVIEYDDPAEGSGYMEIEDGAVMDGFPNWGIGRMESATPPADVTIDVVPYDGYKDEPPEISDMNVPLMSDRLRQSLQSAGVDNIISHPVKLRNTETGQIYPYHAFNLIGLVSAADLQKSQIESPDGDFIGDSSIKVLVLDADKAHGMLMFRLAERFGTILVHESVRSQIEASGITTLKFIAPEDYYRL